MVVWIGAQLRIWAGHLAAVYSGNTIGITQWGRKVLGSSRGWWQAWGVGGRVERVKNRQRDGQASRNRESSSKNKDRQTHGQDGLQLQPPPTETHLLLDVIP